MVNDPAWVPTEGVVLEEIRDLHLAMYDKVAAIGGVLGLEKKGFDSGRTSTTLPAAGIKIALQEISVDRGRPTPSEGNRLLIKSGDEQTYDYEGETYTEYPERIARYPLPVNVVYRISSWCHSAETQLALDQGVLQAFPERGTLQLSIGGTEYDFPVELLQIQTLGDLADNRMERMYLFRVEAWVRGTKPDVVRKIILRPTVQYYEGSLVEDVNYPGKLLFEVVLEPTQ